MINYAALEKVCRALDEAEVPPGPRYIYVWEHRAKALVAAGVLRETDTPDVYEIVR